MAYLNKYSGDMDRIMSTVPHTVDRSFIGWLSERKAARVNVKCPRSSEIFSSNDDETEIRFGCPGRAQTSIDDDTNLIAGRIYGYQLIQYISFPRYESFYSTVAAGKF